VITPRVTRLVRVPDLKAMRDAISRLAIGGDLSVRRTAVLVPTRGAGEALRRSLENAASRAGLRALLMPDILSRSAFYDQLHAALPGAPAMLSAPEREVLLRRAAREAIVEGAIPPFRLRAGLVLQMLDFYDELRRREQTLDDFARHTTARLADSAEIDRGAERLLRQTEFLCATFATFERRTLETGSLDEHALRAMLLDPQAPAQRAFTRVIVTVADQAADALGLFASDFDMLARLRGIEQLDIVATESRLAAGFHERIHNLLPGVEEVRLGESSAPPVVAVPENAEPTQPWFVSRDREEELVRIVRWLKARSSSAQAPPPPLDRIGLVFQRPLPYLYLARQVFPDGGIPYEAVDALPLSAEPYAAAVDLVLSFLGSEGNRASVVELLRSPHFVFHQRLQRGDVASLDDWFLDLKYAGGWRRLGQLESGKPAIGRALTQARDAAVAAQAMDASATASAQIDALLAFLRTFERQPDGTLEWAPRHFRARAAVLAALHALRDAHAKHDDERVDMVELSSTVRRWIDAQTFAPRTGEPGLWLLDAVSAPYADVDELHLLGLVEREWPEPPRRSIFYPSSILANLGWPADASRMVAARANFQDLLWAPHHRVAASVFTLEDDAIVAPSPLLEEIDASGLLQERWPLLPTVPVFLHEAVQQGDREIVAQIAGHAPIAAWLDLRLSRTAGSDLQFRGMTGVREPQTYAISYLERYLDCPFKYFANRVLRLPEERDEESGLSAIERGHFIHDVFETFFRAWQAGGGRAITIDTVADALLLFQQIAEQKLEKLPEADRALERNHLLGSAAASGLAERAFAFEIEQGGDVLERLLEHELEGEYTFAGPDGPRRVSIRSKADRLDLLADGTIRVIDYKTGRAPKANKALQLPIYGVIATQDLEGRLGRSWRVGNAGYVAFKEKDAFVPMGGRMSLAEALADGQLRLLKAVDGIERGQFPVDPDEPFRCQWCGYGSVCRKDYVGDE
jgi:RecB family exonuclease